MRRKDDCSLVAVKKDVFDVEAVSKVAYNDLCKEYKSNYFETHSTAVLIVAKHKETDIKFVFAASHLYWNPKFALVKLA